MTFANKLKLIRKTNNLTQAAFAQSIGISRGNLSGFELGKVSPTLLQLIVISLMYNIDKNWLIDENNIGSKKIIHLEKTALLKKTEPFYITLSTVIHSIVKKRFYSSSQENKS